MTGREFIIYILRNGLEDEEIIKDGRPFGFMTREEFAVSSNIGIASVDASIKLGIVKSVKIGDTIYIMASNEAREANKNE